MNWAASKLVSIAVQKEGRFFLSSEEYEKRIRAAKKKDYLRQSHLALREIRRDRVPC